MHKYTYEIRIGVPCSENPEWYAGSLTNIIENNSVIEVFEIKEIKNEGCGIHDETLPNP